MNGAGGPTLFDSRESERYARHLILPGIGPEGQSRLKGASVLVVGAGGLGSPLLQYLAAAGVGTIGIADHDRVELSNLQRQVIYSSSRAGMPKVGEAMHRINEINPHVVVRPHPVMISPDNAPDIIRPYDVVADATDNFPSRYLLNDTCVALHKPLVHGSLYRFEGQVTAFGPSGAPCYRCLFPQPPPPGLVPDCGEGGVLGAVAGVIGSLQAVEVIKIITGCGKTLSGRLLAVDALTMSFREVTYTADPACRVCGPQAATASSADYGRDCGPSRTESSPVNRDIAPRELHSRLERGERPVLLDVREPGEHAAANIGGVLIPLGELPARLGEIERDYEVVVYCRTGRRSAHAADILRRAGFPNVRNLSGGIVAWRAEVDRSLPRC